MAQSVMERKAQSSHAHRSDGRLRVAVYCRVNPDSGDSLNSLEAQRTYYTQEIQAHPNWKLAGIFADASGILGPSQKVFKGRTFPDLIQFFIFIGKHTKRGDVEHGKYHSYMQF